MKNEILMPCTEWTEKLAARHPEDISPVDRIAVNNHIASCKACAAVYAAYHAMEISVRALPTTSLSSLPYDKLRREGRPIMPPLSSLVVYFGLFSREKSQTATPFMLPIRRSMYIKQSVFYHAIVACLALILIVAVVGLSVCPRPITPEFSSAISTPTAFAGTPTLSNSISLGIRPINSLFLTLYRLCPDDSYPQAPQRVDLTQQQRQREKSACSVLQTEG